MGEDDSSFWYDRYSIFYILNFAVLLDLWKEQRGRSALAVWELTACSCLCKAAYNLRTSQTIASPAKVTHHKAIRSKGIFTWAKFLIRPWLGKCFPTTGASSRAGLAGHTRLKLLCESWRHHYSCVTSVGHLNLSEPQLPHLWNGDNDTSPWGLYG